MLDRQRVKEEFASYTRNYNAEDVKIALKIAHTYRVADHCEQIAKSLDMSDEDVEFAWLSGMLHDIGRFEQVTRYNTFIDSQSVDHAEFGADLLFGNSSDSENGAGAGSGKGLIERFLDDKNLYEMLEIVIRQHNKYRIKEGLDERTLVFCNILRDADKVDILRVNVESPMEEIYNVSCEDLATCGVSEAVMEQVRKRIAVNRSVMTTAAEHLIGHIALNFELVYKRSIELAIEQGYIYKMFDFKTTNPTTKAALEETRKILGEYLEEKGCRL